MSIFGNLAQNLAAPKPATNAWAFPGASPASPAAASQAPAAAAATGATPSVVPNGSAASGGAAAGAAPGVVNPNTGVVKPSGAGLGAGWDQYAVDPKSFQYGLKTAFENGYKGEDAIGWMDQNGWKGAQNSAGGGIQYYPESGQYGLPGGYKVVPGQNGGLDIYQAGGPGSPSGGARGGALGALTSSLAASPAAGDAGSVDPNAYQQYAGQPGSDDSGGLRQLLATLMGGQSQTPNV